MRSWRTLLAVAVLSVLLGTLAVVGLAAGETCFEPGPSDLSLSRMARVKRAVDAHTRAPSEPLILDGDEATFLLADYLAYPVTLKAEDSEVRAELAAPAMGTCFNIRYAGGIAVTEAGMQLSPRQLTIGYLDVSFIARLRHWHLPQWLPLRPHAARLVAATKGLEVRDGILSVHIADPWSLK